MAEKEASKFNLTAPDGTKVTVVGETRRDTLLKRGYKSGSVKVSGSTQEPSAAPPPVRKSPARSSGRKAKK